MLFIYTCQGFYKQPSTSEELHLPVHQHPSLLLTSNRVLASDMDEVDKQECEVVPFPKISKSLSCDILIQYFGALVGQLSNYKSCKNFIYNVTEIVNLYNYSAKFVNC